MRRCQNGCGVQCISRLAFSVVYRRTLWWLAESRRRLASLRWMRHKIEMFNMEDSNVIRLVYWCRLLVCFDSHTARQDADVVEGKPFLCLTPFCVTFQSRRCRQPFYHFLVNHTQRERERDTHARLIGGMILPRPLLCPKIRHTRQTNPSAYKSKSTHSRWERREDSHPLFFYCNRLS